MTEHVRRHIKLDVFSCLEQRSLSENRIRDESVTGPELQSSIPRRLGFGLHSSASTSLQAPGSLNFVVERAGSIQQNI
jgi:hypothetical protein